MKLDPKVAGEVCGRVSAITIKLIESIVAIGQREIDAVLANARAIAAETVLDMLDGPEREPDPPAPKKKKRRSKSSKKQPTAAKRRRRTASSDRVQGPARTTVEEKLRAGVEGDDLAERRAARPHNPAPARPAVEDSISSSAPARARDIPAREPSTSARAGSARTPSLVDDVIDQALSIGDPLVALGVVAPPPLEPTDSPPSSEPLQLGEEPDVINDDPDIRRWRRGRRRRSGQRSRATGIKRITQTLLRAESLEIGAGDLQRVDDERPTTRAECYEFPRPCPWVGCRHHLYLEVTPCGSIKIVRPDVDITRMAQTCSLDLAELGGRTLEQVGELNNVTRERTRQDEVRALLKLKSKCEELGIDADDFSGRNAA